MALVLPRATTEHVQLPTAIGSDCCCPRGLDGPLCLFVAGCAPMRDFYYLTGCWGITFCHLRLLSHKSFKANKWLTYLTLAV
ncbi:MAG: hypothetical protein R2857_04820 [Vampirovibrionales bacterium]